MRASWRRRGATSAAIPSKPSPRGGPEDRRGLRVRRVRLIRTATDPRANRVLRPEQLRVGGHPDDCTKERFCNTPTPDVFATGYAVRNGIAGEIRLAIPFCNVWGPCAYDGFNEARKQGFGPPLGETDLASAPFVCQTAPPESNNARPPSTRPSSC